MDLLILQENLNKGLGVVSRFVASKSTLPILGNILLTTDQGRLKLSATNLENGINLWLGAKIEKEGSITVPAKLLTEFVNSLPSEKIKMETKETSLFIEAGQFKANFNGTPPTEFPQIPSFDGEPVLVFSNKNLTEALSQVIFAAAQDDGRPILTGVLIMVQGKRVSLVATDGYRLSLKNVLVKENKLKKNLLIPAKALLEISKMAQEKNEKEEKEVKIGLTPEKSQVIFLLPDIELSSRLLEGEFPEFEKIIPKNSSTRVEIDKEEFLKAVRITSIFAREQANIIKLKVDPTANEGKITISAENPQLGGNESEVSAKTEGEKLEIAFNYRFLLDLLSCPLGEEIVFEANGSLSPGVFKIKGDDSFLHVIMPVRIQA